MTFVDIAIYAVPTENKEAFKAHSELVAPLFKKHGALAAMDCWGAVIPEGDVTSLPLAVKCAENETVAYSHLIWPSKEARDEGMEKAMAEMQTVVGPNGMPFDGSRLIFGGFEPLVSL